MNKVEKELRRIATENGGVLQPQLVVEHARPKSSPLHSRFEWSDTKAAHQYRIWQARMLIRVMVETIEGIKGSVDVFVSLTTDRYAKSGGYRIITDVLSDKEMRAQMLADALADLEIFKAKYSRLQELSAVFQAIKKVRKR